MIFSAQLLAVCVAVISSEVKAQNAFPGALGFGAIATGGNSGTTYYVTNLNDSGTGSFRDAVSASNRNIVFNVGGYIVLESAVSLSSDITINGQSAPGDGIGIMAGEVSASGSTNIIIRNLRMRQGTLDPDTGKSAFNMGTSSNIILDHCSFEYGQWDSVDAVGAVNITVSNSIIAFPIGQQFGAHVETGPSTFYGNLWVSAHNRQPLSKDNTQYINNVVYNYQAAYTSADTAGYFSHDIINNYFIAGPSTTSAGDAYFQMASDQSVYATGNYIDSNKDGVLNGAASNTVGSSVVLSEPWADTSLSMATLTAAEAVSAVLSDAGASPRDEVDAFAVSTANTLGTSGTIYTNQDSTGLSNGGYGTLTDTVAKARLRDTDQSALLPDANANAIADFWEEAHGISVTVSNTNEALFGDSGYTNLVAYLSSLILPQGWTSADLNSPSLNGASTYNSLNGLWAITGSGQNQPNGFDQCQFASRQWTSDSMLTGKVNNVTEGKAGLLLRGSAEPQPAFVAVIIDALGTISLLWRESNGVATKGISKSGFSQGVSLRLEQSGSDIVAYTSTDGTSWGLFGTAKATFTGATRSGMAVTSDEPSSRAVATFSDVNIISHRLEL